jgi:L-ribulose-5-phosphate 4-epimerase
MSDELERVRAQFAEAARRAYQRGIQTGNGGNISARVPGKPLMVVKPSGVSLADCTPETMTITDFNGNVVEGNRKPTRESVLHGELYKNLPEVGGVVHTHSPWSIAWSFTGRELPLSTLHSQLKLAHPTPVRFFASPKGVLKEEMPIVLDLFAAQPDLKAFIMVAHGIVAVGPDVLEAEHTAELVEETAQVAYLHEVGARLNLFSIESAVIGNRSTAWLIREALVECGRTVAAKGLVVGPQGSISARSGDKIYISANDTYLSVAAPNDFVELDQSTGQLLDGTRQPSSEMLMHLACYRKRPDIQAVVRTHPPMSIAAASCGVKFDSAFHGTDHFLGKVGQLNIRTAAPDLEATVGSAIGQYDAVLLANHGVLAVGTNLKEALLRTELLEQEARIMIVTYGIATRSGT